MRFLGSLRRSTKIKVRELEYIARYRKIYKSVIQDAKKRENEKYIRSSTNKTKATWQLINKKLGKPNKNIEIKWDNSLISNPRVIPELFNLYYVDTIERVPGHNNGHHINYNKLNLNINLCSQTMYITPVSESEVEKVIKNLKGKAHQVSME